QYEYKDHTADIQIHSWGDSMEECFAWAALAMFNYMTPLKRLASSALSAKGSAAGTRVEAHDAHSLLFAFLDELLFNFHTTMTVCNAVQVLPIERGNGTWRVRGTGVGKRFVDGVHEQGTEIKAITYSAMQIVERDEAAM
ncbi:predicted protein, partial [Micromonas commoda]